MAIIEQEVVKLRVGDGPVRVRIGLAYSQEVRDVWIKPRFDIEVTVPEDVDVDDYIEKELAPYAKRKLIKRVRQIESTAGIPPAYRTH